MSCLEMTAVGPELQAPDPTKHVLYNLGMVLGVDDFTQEFAYHSERDQWIARDALGYGTVNGLRISTGTDDKGPFVKVCPGVAITPRGQLVRVTSAHCASLNPWLNANGQALLDVGLTGPSAHLRLYVVLCYRDCPTDQVQIPGEPCKAESTTRVASRIKDYFRLEIRTAPPEQTEEDAVRRFVEWLRQIKPSEDIAGTLTPDEFMNMVRSEAPMILSPLDSPLSPMGSPPAGIAVPADQLCEYLRIAFRIWITELRPKYHREPPPGGVGCEPLPQQPPSPEECLLLADLVLPVQQVGSRWEVAVPPIIAVDESRRPLLLSTRMIQEMLLCGPCCGGEQEEILGGDVTGPEKHNIVEKLQGIELEAAAAENGHFLAMKDGKWQPVRPDPPPPPTPPVPGGDVVGNPDIGRNRIAELQGHTVNAANPGANDVLTYVVDPRTTTSEWRPAPIRPVLLQGDVASTQEGQATIQRLGASTGQVLTWGPDGNGGEKWVPAAIPPQPQVLLRGDVSSQADGQSLLEQIQGKGVKAERPNPGDVLTFTRDDVWVPAKPSGAGSDRIVAGAMFTIFPASPTGGAGASVDYAGAFGGFRVLGYSGFASSLYIKVDFNGFLPLQFIPWIVSGTHWGPPEYAAGVLDLVDSRKRSQALDSIEQQMTYLVEIPPSPVPGVRFVPGLLLRLTFLQREFPRDQGFGLTVQITRIQE